MGLTIEQEVGDSFEIGSACVGNHHEPHSP